MHIAYVCTDPGIPAFGTKGASIHVQEMLRAFIACGAEVTLISPHLSGPIPSDLSGVRLISLPHVPRNTQEARERGLVAINAEVEAALSGLDAVDLIYERHALFAYGAMEWAAAHGVPSVLEVNAPLIAEQAQHRVLALAEQAKACAVRAMQAASVVIGVSPEVARYAKALGAKHPHVVPNGVNPARFPATTAPEGPFTIGFLGTLKPWHDVSTLIEAFTILRRDKVADARLMIVGEGPEREALQAQIASHGLQDACHFTGALAAAEVPGALAHMHVAVAPYSGNQAFYFSPLKIYEYMAAGLPVVASCVGHLPDVVADGQTGLLCEPDAAASLAERLAQLVEDPALRERLAQTARAQVLADHTWEGVAQRVLGLAAFSGHRAA